MSKEDYSKFTDDLIKVGLEEMKTLAISRRNAQDGKIRQLLYLFITLTTAIFTLIAQTPLLNSKPLFVVGGACLITLTLGLVGSAIGLIYGVYALLGEDEGKVPTLPKMEHFLEKVSFEADSKETLKAKVDLLKAIDLINSRYRKRLIPTKAKKIRELNSILLFSLVFSALATIFLFIEVNQIS